MIVLWSAFCTQITWTYLACVNSQHRGTLDSELFLSFCTQAPWAYMIAILHSGHTDLYDCHFVLRPHRPIWSVLCSAFCTQVTWTYFACVNSQHRRTSDSYFCHFVLRPHRPTWLPFCTQVTQTYMVAILCSGCIDLYDGHFALRLHGPIIYILHLNAMLPSAIPTYLHPHNVHMYHSISCDITNINIRYL